MSVMARSDARIEAWFDVPNEWRELAQYAVPMAIEVGRGVWAEELRTGAAPTNPIRVVDTSGAVVAQWGKP